MNFIVDKCKVMHTGKNSLNYTYTVLGSELTAMTQKIDLGVTVVNSVKASNQCGTATKKENHWALLRRKLKTKQNHIIPL